MRLFRRAPSAHPSDVAAVREKLAAVEQEITTASAELDRLALRAVLAGDQSATEATAHLDELRQRRELLTRALAAAEQAEQAERGALNAREFQARRRALSQHAGRLQRDATDLTAALTNLRDAFDRLTATGSAITALLPEVLRSNGRAWHEHFSRSAMHDLMEVEAHRISPATTRRPRLLLQFTDDQTGTITPLAETLADLLTNLRRELDQAAPAASLADHALPVPAMPAAAGVSSAAPVASGCDPWPEVGENGALVDLRGVDLGVVKPSEQQGAAKPQTDEVTA